MPDLQRCGLDGCTTWVDPSSDDLLSLQSLMSQALTFSRRLKGPLYRDDDARDLWHQVYGDLSDGKPGMTGAATSRAEAQVMRLAVIYTLLDQRTQIGLEHLRAALALWDYCEHSARYIFGDTLGDHIADEIISSVRSTKSGLTRTEIRDLLGRHHSARMDAALQLLLRHGLVTVASDPTRGRPVERWRACSCDISDQSDQRSETPNGGTSSATNA